jgi:hypothetical protein
VWLAVASLEVHIHAEVTDDYAMPDSRPVLFLVRAAVVLIGKSVAAL